MIPGKEYLLVLFYQWELDCPVNTERKKDMKNKCTLIMLMALMMLFTCFPTVTATTGTETILSAARIVESIPGKATVTEVVISGSHEVTVGKTTKLKAEVKPSSASQKVTWKSSNTKIATVSAAGKVKGIKKGKVTITATSKANPKIKAKWKMTVKEKENKPTKVIISGSKYVSVGGTTTLNATVKPAAANQTVTWKSSDTTIATISTKGVVKGVKQGNVTITAASKVNPKVKATWKMTVTEGVSSVEITGSKFVAVGYAVKLKASVKPENAMQTVTWESSNTKIATVTSKGLVTGIKAGKVKITATSQVDSSIKKTWDMTVKKYPVSQIAISPDQVILYLDGVNSVKLSAEASPDGAAESFTWRSRDPKIAVVSDKGEVTGIKAGATTIVATATDGSNTEASVNVVVQEFSPEEFAYDFTYQTYDYNARTCYITAYTGNNTEITIPRMSPEGEKVIGIMGGVFQDNTNITKVVIPNTLEWIGDGAFARCSRLVSLELSYGLKVIGNSAFINCIHLRELTVPGSVSAINTSAFEGCTALTNLTIENGVAEIQYSAFSGCSALTNVHIPSSVVTVNGFNNCVSLTTVTLESGITNLYGAFQNCKSLNSITIPATVTEMASVCSGCISLTEIIILEGVPIIGSNAFYGCQSLKTVYIPKTVTTIDSWAFYDCTSLASLVMDDGLVEIGYCAFGNCTNLHEVEIPSTVFSIGSNAFINCTNLTDVTIPDGVVTIAGSAFDSCSSLYEVHIPSSVIRIESCAFQRSGVTKLTVDEGLIELGDCAFYDCSHLSYVKLPNSLVTIGSYAIVKTDNLTEIHCPAGSNAWRYALDNDITPIDTSSDSTSDPDDTESDDAAYRQTVVTHAYKVYEKSWTTDGYILLYYNGYNPSDDSIVVDESIHPVVVTGNVRGIPYTLSSNNTGGGEEKSFEDYFNLSASDRLLLSNKYTYNGGSRVSMKYGMSCATFVTDCIRQGLPRTSSNQLLNTYASTNIHESAAYKKYITKGSADNDGYKKLKKGDYLYKGSHVMLVVENDGISSLTVIEQTPPDYSRSNCTKPKTITVELTYGGQTQTYTAKQLCMECDACRQAGMGTQKKVYYYSALTSYTPMYVDYNH